MMRTARVKNARNRQVEVDMIVGESVSEPPQSSRRVGLMRLMIFFDAAASALFIYQTSLIWYRLLPT